MLLLALTVGMAVGSPAAPSNTPAAAASPAPAAAPAPAKLVIAGVWRGREVEDGGVGVRVPTITFTDTDGRLAYDDSRRGAGTISVHVENLVVKGSTVRFTVRGPGGKRDYTGKWDGTRISGTTSGTPDGAGPGTFELERVVYDDSPRLPFVAARAERATRERDRDNARVVYAPTAWDSDSGSSGSGLVFQSDIARQRGLQKVAATLSSVSGAPDSVISMVDQYESACTGEGAPLYDCDRALAQLKQVTSQVDRMLTQAEDDARQAGIEPGVVRDMRTRFGVDEGDWSSAQQRVREAGRRH